MEPTACGGWFATATANSCVAARPSLSVAVTVTTAWPFASASTVTTALSTEAPISVASEDETE